MTINFILSFWYWYHSMSGVNVTRGAVNVAVNAIHHNLKWCLRTNRNYNFGCYKLKNSFDYDFIKFIFKRKIQFLFSKLTKIVKNWWLEFVFWGEVTRRWKGKGTCKGCLHHLNHINWNFMFNILICIVSIDERKRINLKILELLKSKFIILSASITK